MITFEDRYKKIEGDDPEQEFCTEVVKVKVPCKTCDGIGSVKGKWDMIKVCPMCLGRGYFIDEVVLEKTFRRKTK